jgi:hypothetical protein
MTDQQTPVDTDRETRPYSNTYKIGKRPISGTIHLCFPTPVTLYSTFAETLT